MIKGSAPVWHGLVDPASNRASGYTYDANGNASSPSLQNSFDIENRIVSQTAWVQSSQYLYGYGYDPDNRRIYNATSTYDPGSGGFTLTNEEVTFWSPTGQRMGTYLLLVNPGGGGYAPSLSFRWTNSERVYFGNRLIWRGGTTVYSDRLGSVGKYFPYGEERPAATGGDGEKFATYFRESATGLDYAANRYYDAGMGRFLTPDPYRASATSVDDSTNPASWNRYAYVQGDPINFNDAPGLFPCAVGVGESAEVVNCEVITFDLIMPQAAKEAPRSAKTTWVDALFAALDALKDPKCKQIFNTDPKKAHSYDPRDVLASMVFRGGDTYFGDLMVGRIPLGYDAVTVADPKTSVSTGTGVQAASANIVLQGNPLSDGYYLNQDTTDLAFTLIHELGHVFNIVSSLGGSQILTDANPDGTINWDAQKRNGDLLRQNCNPRNPK